MIEVKNKILYYFFQFYCLPDNYEVIDSSLDDIKVSLNLTIEISFMPSVTLATKEETSRGVAMCVF